MSEIKPADVERTFEVLNSHDLRAFQDLIASNASVSGGLLTQDARGKGAVIESLSRAFTAFPDAHVTPKEVFIKGNDAAIFGELSGTHKGPLERPGGETLPPSGKYIRADAAFRLRFDDEGKVIDIVSLTDRSAILKALGGER